MSSGWKRCPDTSESPTTITEARRDQRSAFEDAAQAVAGGAGQGSGDPASFGIEIGNVESWALTEGALIPENALANLPLVSNSTSEHEVFYRFHDDRAIKRTWPGVYGQIPIPADGGLGRRNATPSEYLRRMALHEPATLRFRSTDEGLEGETTQGTQRFIKWMRVWIHKQAPLRDSIARREQVWATTSA